MANLCRCLCVCLLIAAGAWTLCTSPSKAQAPAESAAPAAPVPDETILDVRVAGNQTVDLQKITPHIQTRAGRPFNIDLVTEDVRRLTKTRLFVNVDTTYQRSTEGGLIVIFRVAERPTLQYVKYLGSTMRETALTKQTNLKPGDSQDPFMVVEARRKLEEYYRGKGYGQARVEIQEGDQPGDKGAIFVINEGKKQRIEKIEFIGNTIASDARLKTVVSSKLPWLYFIKGEAKRETIDEDVEKLTSYYRSLGFFRARVGRELDFDEEQQWLTLRFVIDEGPRYTVRGVSIIGNKKFDSSELLEDIKLYDGEFFDQGLMDRDVATLQDHYGANGYIFAAVEAEPRFLEEPGQLDLVYHVQEGDRYHIGNIEVKVEGETPRTRRMTVMNYMNIYPGDIADTRALRAGENRLQRSGLFTNNPAQGVAPRIYFKQPGLNDFNDTAAESQKPKVRGQSPDPATQPTVRFQSPYPSTYTPGSTAQGYDGGAGQVPLGRTSPDAVGGYASPTMVRDPVTGQFRPAQYTPPPAAAYPTSPASNTPAYPAAPSFPAAQPYPTATAAQPAPSYAPNAGYPVGTTNGPPAYLAQPTPGGAQPVAPFAGPPLPNAPGGGVTPNPNDGFATPSELFPPDGYSFLNEPDPTRPVDVVANVTEAQTGRLMFGVGVNSNAGLVGSLILDEQNFDWRRLPRNFDEVLSGRAWRGGGQQLRIEAVPGNQVSRYSFTFRQPYLFDGPVSYNFSGYYFQRFYQDWSEQRLGGQTGLGYQFPNMPNLSVGATLRMENVTIYNPRIPTPAPITAVLGDTSLYTFRTNLAHDTRDSTFLATQGHLVQLGFEQAFSDFDYSRGTIDAQQHFLLRERADRSGRHTLALVTQLGFSGNDTPVYENFFAGGYSSLRGFRFRGASPMELGSQVGGRFQWLNTVEYMMPVTADDALRAVAFVDFGTVEQNITLTSQNFRVAPGLGLRITIPMMGPAPIALDFAVPVAHAPGDQIQNFAFFIGATR